LRGDADVIAVEIGWERFAVVAQRDVDADQFFGAAISFGVALQLFVALRQGRVGRQSQRLRP
jgi:hypothetical protein